MAYSQVVLLLVAGYICLTSAQFSNFGNYGGQQPFAPGYSDPHLLTCIGRNEALDHLKITIRPEPRGGPSSPAFQFGNPVSTRRELVRRDWRISAVYIPAASLGVISPAGTSSLVGQFFLAVTRYGRTDGSCAGLGGILQNEDTIRPGGPEGLPGLPPFPRGNPLFGGNPYLRPPFPGQQPPGFPGQPPFSPFNPNPFSRFLNGGGRYGPQPQPQTPPGYIQDPIVISQGGNVYSGVIRDLSEVDLRGRGMAVCLDYACQRPTTTCCSIVKDARPATENVGAPTNPGPVNGNYLNNPTGAGALGGGVLGGGGGALGGGGNLGGGGALPGTGGTGGGLF